MNKYTRLLSHTAILGVGTFASKVLVFLLMPLYTRCLSTAEYSTADLITQMANLLIPLACVGICDGLFRFTLDRDERREGVFSSGIFVLLIAGAVFLLLSPLLLLIPYFKPYVWLIVLYCLCANLHAACAQYLRACGHMKLFAVQGLMGTAATIFFNVLFLVGWDMGVIGYVLSVVVADAAITLFLVLYAKLYRAVKWRLVSGKLIVEMLKYCVPLIPTTVFWWITNVSDRYMVAYFCGDAVNGLYSVAYKIPTLITLAAVVFMEAWQFSAVKDSDKAARSHFFSVVYGSYQGILFMGASVLVLLAKVFTSLMYAPDYFESWRYLPILTLATVFSSLVTFMGSVYMVSKKSVMSFVTSLTGAGLNVVLNFLLIPRIGAYGAAIATMASYVVVYIIRVINSRRYERFCTHSFKIIVNGVLLSAQCVLMMLEVKGWIGIQILFVAAILALNSVPIIKGVFGQFGVLKIRRKK